MELEHAFGGDLALQDMEIHPPSINLESFGTPKKRATSGPFCVSIVRVQFFQISLLLACLTNRCCLSRAHHVHLNMTMT